MDAATPLPEQTAPPVSAPSTPVDAPTAGATWAAADQAGATPMATTPQTSKATVDGQQPMPVQPASPPIVLQKPGGIKGLIDSISDVLGGKTRPEIAQDQDGNSYVKNRNATGGEKWARVGSDLLHGAAAGYAAGQGPGGGARALEAGVAAGDKANQQRKQAAQQMTEEARQQTLDNANNQMLQMKKAETAFAATQAKVKANRDTIDFVNKDIDRLTKPTDQGGEGGQNLGTMAGPNELRNILKVQPDVMQRMVQDGTIQIRNNYAEDGTVQGIHVIMMPKEYNDAIAPAGSQLVSRDPMTNTLTYHNISEPMPKRQLDNLNSAAVTSATEFDTKKATDAAALAHTKAETWLAQAGAAKDAAEMKKMLADAEMDPAKVSSLGELAARGGLTEDMISNFGKGTKSAVQQYLAEHHPNLNQDSIFVTAQERRAADLANNAIHNLTQIPDILQRRPDLVGTFDGLLSGTKKAIGTNDPDLASLQTLAGLYTLPAQGAHGSRSAQIYGETKNDIINNLKNGPVAINASIQRSLSSLQNLANVGKPKGVDGTPYVYGQQPQQSAPQTPNPAAAQLPQQAVAALKEGVHTTFANGQTWTLQNGKPVQIQAAQPAAAAPGAR